MILKGGKATTKPKSYDGKLDTILFFKKKKKKLRFYYYCKYSSCLIWHLYSSVFSLSKEQHQQTEKTLKNYDFSFLFFSIKLGLLLQTPQKPRNGTVNKFNCFIFLLLHSINITKF